MTGGTKAFLLSSGLTLGLVAMHDFGVTTEWGVIVGLLTGINYLLWVAYYDRRETKKGTAE